MLTSGKVQLQLNMHEVQLSLLSPQAFAFITLIKTRSLHFGFFLHCDWICREHAVSSITDTAPQKRIFYLCAFSRRFDPERLTNEDITSKLTISYVEGNHQSGSVRGDGVEMQA